MLSLLSKLSFKKNPKLSSSGGEVRECLVAVLAAVTATADVQPAGTTMAVFEEHLVEVRMVHQELIPTAARVDIGDVQVGSLAIEVLRVAHAMYRLVQCLAAVAAIDVDGLLGVVAQRLQHFAAQVAQVDDHLPVRSVVNLQGIGRGTLNKLFQLEVRRQLHLWIVHWFIHSVFVLVISVYGVVGVYGEFAPQAPWLRRIKIIRVIL